MTSRPTTGSTGRSVDLAARFRAAWTSDDDPQTADPDLLPTRLTRACVELLNADGAGLGLFDADFRVPLGASDAAANFAEQLQFTHGEGPCLRAGSERRTVVIDRDEMVHSWPAYAAEMLERTPFTAVISLPLVLADAVSGALDLFFADSARLHEVSLADATTITEQISEALALAQDAGNRAVGLLTSGGIGPNWLQTSTARVRAYVWIATGMTMARFALDAATALALLRSFGYGRGSLLDEVAVELVEGRLSLEQMMA